MARSTIFLMLLAAVLPRSASGQQPTPAWTLAVGLGNAFGGMGVRGDVFVLGGHLSALAGGGVIGVGPYGAVSRYNLDQRMAGAASIRGYVGGKHHRLYADLSWSLLKVNGWDWSATVATGYDLLLIPPEGESVEPSFDYGLGLSLGYTFVSGSGLTLTAGAGVGFANSGPACCGRGGDDADRVPILQLGIGWTRWRRGGG